MVVILIIKPHFSKYEPFTTDSYALMNDTYDDHIINNIITKEETKYIIDNATIQFRPSNRYIKVKLHG
jgi:hypothetical protein